MRIPTVYSRRRDPLDVKMTPMIDVVFLLLVFFLWTSSFHIVEHVLPSDVSQLSPSAGDEPATKPPEELDFDAVVIRVLWVDGAPAWRIHEAPILDLAALRAHLQAIAEVKSDAPVIVDPDGETPLGHVIDVYDAARLTGFSQVQLAASAP